MTRKREAKLSPLQRLINRNQTQLKNLKKKRAGIVENYDEELANIDGTIDEINVLLKQLTKK